MIKILSFYSYSGGDSEKGLLGPCVFKGCHGFRNDFRYAPIYLGAFGGLLTIAKETGLIAALIITIGWLWRRNAVSKNDIWAIMTNCEMLSMFYMVSAIMVLKGVLTDSMAVSSISRELINWNISLVPITIILPFW